MTALRTLRRNEGSLARLQRQFHESGLFSLWRRDGRLDQSARARPYDIYHAQPVSDGFGNAIGDSIVAQQQQIGLAPQEKQQMDSQIAAASNTKLAQDGQQINEDITATLAQESAQATAAGSTDTTTESPLTNNIELSSSLPLQPIVGPIQTPSLAGIGQEIETGLQQGSLPGGSDQWTTFLDPTAGQQVAQNRTTGDDLVWDSTNDEWNPAPQIPEIVVSATREPTRAQYTADQQQLAPGNMAFAGTAASGSAQQLAADAGTMSTAFDVSGQIGQFAATFSTQQILGKSSTVPSDLQVEIATTAAQDSSDIVHELQGANSEAAQSLASAAEAYGPALKWGGRRRLGDHRR